MNTPIEHLTEIGACSSAREWITSGKFADLEAAWTACDNPSWLLWYAGRKAGPIGDPKRKVLVTIACECARLVLDIFENRYPDDKRARKAIETAEAWVRGEVGTQALIDARSAAISAAYSAAAYSAAYAAYAAAYTAPEAAAYAAYSAADYHTDAAYVAAAYATDAASTYDAAVRANMRARCVAIIKKHYPTLPR